MEQLEVITDYLFFHLYIWARANDEQAKASIACHMMSFVLIAVFASLLSISTLIMPKNSVIFCAVIMACVLLFCYCEIESRYDDCELRKSIVKRYSPTTGIKSIIVVLSYFLIASLPLLLIILFRHL